MEYSTDLHLTVLHVGPAKTLYEEIFRKSGITQPQYQKALSAFISECVARSAQYYQAYAKGLAVLRSEKKWHLVVLVEPNSPLRQIRKESSALFAQFLTECGIRSAQEFIKFSPAIAQHSPTWLPHITLRTVQSPIRAPEGGFGADVLLGPLHLR